MSKQETNFKIIEKLDYQFWPVIKLSDGTIRKGPNAEIVGNYNVRDEHHVRK